ncbi:MAG: hypothetical protein WAK55_07225 [Xanthobacteraceae bacterium]
MLKSAFPCVFMFLILAGCTSNVQMANNKGQKAECRTASFGIVGTLVAASMQQSCVEQYQKDGFHQVSATGLPLAPTSQPKQ